MCFFVVGNEDNNDFEANTFNYLTWNVGIVFSANLRLIDSSLLETEYFQQNLIKDVRDVLTRKISGLSFSLKITSVTTKFNEIYSEFSLDDSEGYLRSPMTGFRFNVQIVLQESCDTDVFDPCEAINQNLSESEKCCVVSSVDFSKQSVLDCLTSQQVIDLKAALCV